MSGSTLFRDGSVESGVDASAPPWSRLPSDQIRLTDPLQTETDPARVRQILSNLLSNAVKYMPRKLREADGADPVQFRGPRLRVSA